MNADFVKRNVEHGLEDKPCSPMEPPDAFSPQGVEPMETSAFALPLQELMKEHEAYLEVLTTFEGSLLKLKTSAWEFSPEISVGLKNFFRFYDEETWRHNRKEERALFPILREKFLVIGEHSPSAKPVTPVDVMENEHLRVNQLVPLVFNFLGLAPRMKDASDRVFVLEQAFQLGQEIVDTMKLHIFKENTVLFPMAQRLLSKEEWDRVARRIGEI